MKKVAFVGNPNVGKSSIINLLAKSNLVVGNWSGVTTEKIEASYIFDHEEYQCVDLPGIYGFSHLQDEERITEEYLHSYQIDCLVNVIDGTSLLNNLNCTMQCRELQMPMVCVFNFEDERIKEGIEINLKKCSTRLGIPILSMSFHDQHKAEELKKIIEIQAQSKVEYRPLLDQASEKLFYQFVNERNYSLKEGIEYFNHCYPDVVMDNRLKVIHSFASYLNIVSSKHLKMSKKIDEICLSSFMGYVIAGMCFLCFFCVILYASKPINFVLNSCLEVTQSCIQSIIQGTPSLFQKFILEGLFGAIGSLLNLLPILALFHFMMGCLQESGYMARISLLTDKLFRPFHLSGKTSLSFILGLGCNVPAIASCLSLENEKMRRKVAYLIPFMSCSARLPIYLFFIQKFFKRNQILIILLLYLFGILIACGLSLIFDIREKENYYRANIVELPLYRIPNLSLVYNKTKRECLSFMKKSFKIVIWVLMILWIMMNFPYGAIENSTLVKFANTISPLFIPLGFGQYWYLVAALIPSIIAKESVVAFLILLNPDMSIIQYPSIVLMSYMVYCACSVPCVMTCSMMIEKFGWLHCIKSVLLMLIVPYVVCLVLFQGLMLFV